MRTRALGRRLARIEEALDAPGVDEATVAVRRMQLRWALLSDDRRTQEAARRALNEDPEQRERADLEIIRHHEIARYGRVASDFVHLFRLRERLLAQRAGEQGGREALNRWRRSMLAAGELPADVPLGKVLDDPEHEPD